MKTKLNMFMLFGVLSLMVFCTPSHGHNVWLNPGDYAPQVGSTVDIGIGWGHQYPADRVDQEMKEDRLEEIRAMDPDGRTVHLTKVSTALYQLNIEKAGAYVVIARIKPGFFTVTPEGRKWGDKTTVDHPIKCTNFHIEAKTVLIAGKDEKGLDRLAGLPLELIPLTNPRNLKSGDKLQVKVLYDGKLLLDTKVQATYAGFEAGDTASHQGSPQGRRYPVETGTDDYGQAVIPLDKAGYWMILLSHRPPYPDKETCDEYMYNTTFTFEVR